jgi:hypothetical protein
MLTDTALRRLQSRSKPYKITDRDGMYVAIYPAETITFQYNHWLLRPEGVLAHHWPEMQFRRLAPDELVLK